MFRSSTKRELQLLDNNVTVGIIRVNDHFDFNKKTVRPFVRNQKREVLMVGRVSYDVLDRFIIDSFNDFYKKISGTKNADEKRKKILEYNELYQLWYQVNQAKSSQDIRLNSLYDDVIYRLYLLGYQQG